MNSTVPRLATLTVLGMLTAAAAADGTVTFDGGPAGWSISGRDTIDADGGNPGANMHGILIDVFGADTRSDSDPDFLGDLTRFGPFTLSIDIKVNSIDFFGTQVPRTLIVDLRDYVDGPYPWVSVWYELGVLTSDRPGWIRYSVDIADPNADTLPPGWGGYGDEDAFGNPRLPANRTFASVLRNVDEVSFTTFVPGYFYGFTNFDIQVDNIHIGQPLGDACPACPADYNQDGGVDGGDVESFFTDWENSAGCADTNADGGIDGGDVEAFFVVWQAGGC